MKFLREMIAKKSVDQDQASNKPALDPESAALAAVNAMKIKSDPDPAAGRKLSDVVEAISSGRAEDAEPPKPTIVPTASAEPKAEKAPSANIWDMEDDSSAAPTAPAVETPAPAPSPAAPTGRRPGRNKTRLLGFEPQDTAVVELFEANAQAAAPAVVKFPVGWVVVIDGPGRGASFPLVAGMSQIGRGADQTIALDYGDTAISRSNHAALAYDPVEHKFHLGHGGKSNLVRLNGKPLLSTEELSDNDEFLIGETTLRLRTFCGPDFNWDKKKSEGDDHVAIA